MKWKATIAIAGAALCLSTACSSQSVGAPLSATPQTFAATLAKAKGGDIIRLAPGTYTGLYFKAHSYAPALTITSADPTHPAVLTNFDAAGWCAEPKALTGASAPFAAPWLNLKTETAATSAFA